MKVAILFLSIVFLAIIGLLLTISLDENTRNLKNIIIEMAFVLLGFSLAVS